MVRDPRSPVAPFSLLTTLSSGAQFKCLCGVQRAINYFGLYKTWWPWNAGPQLVYYVKGKNPAQTTKPAQWLGVRLFWHEGSHCWPRKTGLCVLLNWLETGLVSQCRVIILSSGNWVFIPAHNSLYSALTKVWNVFIISFKRYSHLIHI